MIRSDFKFVEFLWIYLYSKYRKMSMLSMTVGSQKLSLMQLVFLTILDFPGEQCCTCRLIFSFNVPFKAGGVLKIFKKRLPIVNSDSPLQTMREVVTLRIKQNGESRLSVLSESPELLYIIRSFLTPCYKRWGQSQLSILNNTGSRDSPHIW